MSSGQKLGLVLFPPFQGISDMLIGSSEVDSELIGERVGGGGIRRGIIKEVTNSGVLRMSSMTVRYQYLDQIEF
jgi:hypothetical protein